MTGDNGVITQAQKAKEQTELAGEREKIGFIVNGALEIKDSNYKINYDELKKQSDKEFGNNETLVINNMDGTFTIAVNKTGNIYDITSNGGIYESVKVTDEDPNTLAGEGTEESPYLIESIEDLVHFQNEMFNGNTYNGKYVKLAQSLNFNSDNSYVNENRENFYGYDGKLKEALTTNSGWKAGNSTEKFEGVFDGNNKSIINLYSNSALNSERLGIISINYGEVKNINVINVNISISSAEGIYSFVGGVAGHNVGSISNARVSGRFYGDGNKLLIGGVTGNNKGNIENCINYSNISGKMQYAAGIAGTHTGSTIKNCANMGNVLIEEYGSYVGGIVGLNKSDTNDGTISIFECYNTGNIENKTNCCGGIVGNNQTPLIACYNVGRVIGYGETGGITGFTIRSVYNCYNLGTIESTKINEESFVGGISGTVNQYGLFYSYNEGILKKNQNNVVGGVIGQIVDTEKQFGAKKDYYLKNIEDGVGRIGSGSISAESIIGLDEKMSKNDLLTLLNTNGTYYKEDTENINNGYPILEWQ